LIPTLMILPNGYCAQSAGFSLNTRRHLDPELAPMLVAWWPTLGERGWRGIRDVKLIIVDSAAARWAFDQNRRTLDEYDRNLYHMRLAFKDAKWITP